MPFEIRRLTIDTSSWTAVTPPIDCRTIDIEHAPAADGVTPVDILMRTDADNALTQKRIPAGDHYTTRSQASHPLGIPFPSGETVCYLQAASGTGPAVVEYQW